jgi:hypothetical protein
MTRRKKKTAPKNTGGLPKIDLPIAELTLPSTGKKIKYRPFTVKEEKILLVAAESDDVDAEVLAAKQVLNNCLIDVDISSLAIFDLEYVMMVLRSRSVNNVIEFIVTDPETSEKVELSLNVDDVKVLRTEGHTNKIKVSDEFYLFLKYPTIDEFIRITELNSNDPLASYYILLSCLDQLASEEETYNFKDYTDEEINDFMNNMSGAVVQGVEEFFATMPKLRHEIKYTNKDGKEQTFVLEGMRSFFE